MEYAEKGDLKSFSKKYNFEFKNLEIKLALSKQILSGI